MENEDGDAGIQLAFINVNEWNEMSGERSFNTKKNGIFLRLLKEGGKNVKYKEQEIEEKKVGGVGIIVKKS